MDEDVRNIPIADILEPRTVLRLVDKASVDYLALRDSIREKGYLSPLAVRPATVPGKYEIIAGLHRYTIGKDLGKLTLPCIVKHGVTDDEVLALQIQENACHLVTKPVEYAIAIKKLLTLRPWLTLDELAHQLSRPPHWISEQLGLLQLRKAYHKYVERGEIPMGSAYMLAKIPSRLQEQYLDQALTLPAKQFKVLAANVIKQFTEAVKQGKMDAFYSNEFTPQPHMRPIRELKAELESREVGPLIVATEQCQTPLDGFYAALVWVMHMDREAIKDQEAAVRRRQRERTVVVDPEVD